jgi:hypothetical protein
MRKEKSLRWKIPWTMNNEGKYLWKEEEKKERKSPTHTYMRGKEKVHDNKRREEEHMYM